MGKIHIGKQIQLKLKEQGRSVTWFAYKLNYDRSNAYKIFAKSHLDTDLLLSISKILDYDFFVIYSEKMKEEKLVANISTKT